MNDSAVATLAKVKPLCPLFEQCGGCRYQDIPYEKELRVKETYLKKLFAYYLRAEPSLFEPIVASPLEYGYRNRLDLTLRRIKTGECFMGFMPEGRHRILPVDFCAIARKEISDYLPFLREEAVRKLPSDYRIANLVVRTGDDGRLYWGGIGRKSLKQKENDYLWTEPLGKRIFYSLDTFFQSNLSVLPLLLETIERFSGLDSETLFADLYAGVGLFGIFFSGKTAKTVLVEESESSVRLAYFNLTWHWAKNAEIRLGKVESELGPLTNLPGFKKRIAIIDPPRSGLSADVCNALSSATGFSTLMYLSCSPKTLIRDLRTFVLKGWKILRVIPFDFFPKTRHLETLVFLSPPSSDGQ